MHFNSPRISNANSLECYELWPRPNCIIADGPYGLGKYPGEPKEMELADWYAPHVALWSKAAFASTTLWFWNREIAWARIHPILEAHGWIYEETVVWDKGIAHIAGNVNSKTIRGLPVVTEIAVRYTRKVELPIENGAMLPMKQWLRYQWQRSGRPLNESNEACGVKNAATRKYLTQCDHWYFPPGEAVVRMAEYCRRRGKKVSVPYFSIDGVNEITANAWDGLRAKWHHEHALTNVWSDSALRDNERIRDDSGIFLHANQKPLEYMSRMVKSTTDVGDVVWEPFGGLCSGSIAAGLLGRKAFAAELLGDYYEASLNRISSFASDSEAYLKFA